jgi:hypothetical protein
MRALTVVRQFPNPVVPAKAGMTTLRAGWFYGISLRKIPSRNKRHPDLPHAQIIHIGKHFFMSEK